ncbi:protein of ketopantoate reductase family [Pseudohyphozyma bogoriensis]|nr:protein of ketopantoate reductase family [Pseudohyphozyma bogoriensis]
MSEPIDILVIGFGALGTIYSYILSQNENVRITAIARSSYDSMMEHGTTIDSEKFGLIKGWKPYRLVRDSAEANDRPYKYIICTFKCVPDLLPTASVLAPFLEGTFGPSPNSIGPTVVLIQNGIGIEHPVQASYPETPIISCVAWIGANLISSEGVPVVTHGILEKLVIGLYLGEGGDGPHQTGGFADPAGYNNVGGEIRKEDGLKRTALFAQLLSNGGGEVEVAEDIQPKRYQKNIWNAAWSTVCTLSRSTVSAMVAPAVLPYTLPVVRRLGLEVLYIARAWGYAEDVLPLKSIDEAIKISVNHYQIRTEAQTPATPGLRPDAFGSIGFNFNPAGENSPISTANFKPSMLLDIEAGRPSELEPIIGSLLDRARAKAVETPRLDLAYASLKVLQDAAVRKSAESSEYQQHIKDWFLRKPAVAGAGLDGRKEWERAVKMAELERAENVSVRMAGGKQKVTGKPIDTVE